MLYETLLIIGALGLLAQLVLGFGHGHGHADQGHAGDGHVGHGGHGHVDHGHALDHGHAGHGPADHGHADHNDSAHGPSPLWSLLSPLTIFSLCLGAGATGLLVRHALSPVLTALASMCGGAAFYGLIIRPLWALIFRFASTPARALEGTVAASAEALTRFDERGQGLVRLTVDGQIVRVLAHLETDERSQGGAVRPGDQLIVTSVDEQKNVCRVSRL